MAWQKERVYVFEWLNMQFINQHGNINTIVLASTINT